MTKSERIADLMTSEIFDLAEVLGVKPGRWHATIGQHLVYGYERQIGFANGVCLCASVETAWTRGENIKPVIRDFFESLFNEVCPDE